LSFPSTPATSSPTPAHHATLRESSARILALAWPVFIGQIAVIAFSTVDTALVARHATADLAALAIGMAVYITIFVGMMGIVLAISPIVGQAYGGHRLKDAGNAVHQAVWLAFGLAAIGAIALNFPQPFLALAKATPDVAAKVQSYLRALSFALPAALLFTVYRGFNTAVSRPKAVMVIQLGGLALKVPLSMLLVFGLGPVPSLGVMGCGIATAIVMWLQVLIAWWVMRRDPFYAPFEIHRRGEGLRKPERRLLKDMLKLGVPMGLGIGLEVMGFTFMAFFISRLGATQVAGHQIAVNLVSVMFMMPLSLANASTTLVAQRVGANDLSDARRLGWYGMALAAMASATLGVVVYLLREPITRLYTNDAAVVATVLPLLAWMVVFHFFDAIQTVAAFVLRAWRIATVPMFIYAASLIGVGLGGGWWLVFGGGAAITPEWLHGARGYWAASTLGLTCAAVALTALLAFGLPDKDPKSAN
jgi:multidrug resistance protein, MATE family